MTPGPLGLLALALLLGCLFASGFPASASAWPNTEPVPSLKLSLTSSAVTPDGEIVVGGYVDYDRPIVALFRPDGTLDPGFGGVGYVIFDPAIPLTPSGVAVAVRPSGEIVVYERARRLTQLSVTGEIDRSFGIDGVAEPNGSLVPAYGSTDDLALDSAGRIIIVGSTGEFGGQAVAVERFTADGQPDPSFDGDGMVVVSPVPASSLEGYGGMQGGEVVAVRGDDRLLVIGGAVLGSDELLGSGEREVLAAQFDTDGGLDTSFNGDGMVRIPAPLPAWDYFAARALVLTGAGSAVVRLAVVRDSDYGTGGCWSGAAIRLDADGVLDTAFGDAGFAQEPAYATSCPRDFALLDTGGLFAVGSRHHRLASSELTQTLYTGSGRFDPAFGPGPRVMMVAGFGNDAGSIAQMPDGTLVTVGTAGIPDCSTDTPSGTAGCTIGFLLAQQPNGDVVTDFGTHGVATLPGTRICPDPFELCPYPYRREFRRLARRGVPRKTYFVNGALRTDLECRYEVQETCEVRAWYSAPRSKRALARVRRVSINDGEVERSRSRRLSRASRSAIRDLDHLDLHAVFTAEHQRRVRFTERVNLRNR